MNLTNRFKSSAKKIKKELQVYRNVMKDDRTPALAKFLLWAAVSYLLMPFDLIPDFIPVFGQLDDVIVVPALVYFAVKLIPAHVIIDHRNNIHLK